MPYDTLIRGGTVVLPGHGPATTLRNESWIADLEYPLLR